MSRYDDFRSSSGTLDSRDRYDRYSRGPPVMERERSRSRPRRMEDERFELRVQEEDRYGPPARAPGRHYEDEHLVYSSGALVAPDRRRRRDESPSFAPPRLIRRQSSLDTFDRIPRRKMEPAPRAPRVPQAPLHRPSPPGRYREREVYEDIRIAEPDYYGDEEFREFRERDSTHRRRSASMARRRHEEKPYPRKGKTRIPRKFVHVHAILDLGYPYKEEEDTIIIQKALSKEQIDEVITLSRQFRRPVQEEIEFLRLPRPAERVTTEHLLLESHHSPRASHDAFIVEPPAAYRDVEYGYEEVIERPRRHTVSRPRSVSVNTQARVASPVLYVEPRSSRVEERFESRPRESGSLVLVRPRHGDHDDVSDYIHDLEEETRRLRLERQGGIEITRQRDTDIIDNRGNEEEITEIRRQERREPNSRVMRAMMATLT
ncbi:hypothetical protein N7466_008174 [Penicillium verhagenii]|uniref:uncharacterized protein n=1 Tax=Penicillium verhagenii TaxID=1562060 RepID=UPI0025457DEA|nr:uncharacterized protein N7466_008174 [Penicillium verhagenii]KAJ5923987.1 hypothetical protein N7466_008174 [Penicillium verhagenii]